MMDKEEIKLESDKYFLRNKKHIESNGGVFWNGMSWN